MLDNQGQFWGSGSAPLVNYDACIGSQVYGTSPETGCSLVAAAKHGAGTSAQIVLSLFLFHLSGGATSLSALLDRGLVAVQQPNCFKREFL